MTMGTDTHLVGRGTRNELVRERGLVGGISDLIVGLGLVRVVVEPGHGVYDEVGGKWW